MRHSRTLAKGRGDARDHRRENQRLTSDDVDLEVFEVVNGRLTLRADSAVLRRLIESAAGAGLTLSADGKIEVRLGPSLELDSKGRIAVVTDEE